MTSRCPASPLPPSPPALIPTFHYFAPAEGVVAGRCLAHRNHTNHPASRSALGTPRYEDISVASSSYRRFQHISLIKRHKDAGPPPPINGVVALYRLVVYCLRRCWLLGCDAPAAADGPNGAGFTVHAGHSATLQSERIERSYLRAFVREDEARRLATHTTEMKMAELPATVHALRQSLHDRLDRLEASVGSHHS